MVADVITAHGQSKGSVGFCKVQSHSDAVISTKTFACCHARRISLDRRRDSKLPGILEHVLYENSYLPFSSLIVPPDAQDPETSIDLPG